MITMPSHSPQTLVFLLFPPLKSDLILPPVDWCNDGMSDIPIAEMSQFSPLLRPASVLDKKSKWAGTEYRVATPMQLHP